VGVATIVGGMVVDWRQFHDWLVSQGKRQRTVKTNLQYAKRFHSVLDTGDASALTALPRTRSKEITIVALANYAKFTGRYEQFRELKKRYGLKWNTNDSTQFFERFFNEGLSLEGMLQRIQKMMASTRCTDTPNIAIWRTYRAQGFGSDRVG
jgi:hypothetical protein